MTQKLKKALIVLGFIFSTGFMLAPVAHAVSCTPGSDGCVCSDQGCDDGVPAGTASDTDCNNPNPSPDSINSCVKHNQIIVDLNVIVNILAAFVGVAVTASIVLGGVQYAMAGDSPDGVSKAKQRITNGLIALIVFILTYAFLQWVIPGGVFS